MNSSKLIRTVLILIVAGAAVTGIADSTSRDYAQESLSRALVTYAAARTLNGVVSVAQGTEVALEPGGVGVVLTPGQVLDPINDLIERFSSVMLVAASSLGLQIILLKITSAWGVTVLLIVALVAWLLSVWWPKLQTGKYKAFITYSALVLVFVRFAVPIVVICTNFVFSTFLLAEHDTAAAALDVTSERIEQINNRSEPPETGETQPQSDPAEDEEAAGGYIQGLIESGEEYVSRIGDSTRELASGAADWFDTINVGDRMSRLKASATEATGHIIDLIVIFVLQTILFPLAFLWLFVEVLKATAARTISAIGARKQTPN